MSLIEHNQSLTSNIAHTLSFLHYCLHVRLFEVQQYIVHVTYTKNILQFIHNHAVEMIMS